MVMAVQLIIKISVILDPFFVKKCGHNLPHFYWSVAYTLICFIRFLVFYYRRMTVKKKSDNGNVLIAVEYIQQYVNEN